MKFINIVVCAILMAGLASACYAQESVEAAKLGLIKTGKSGKSLLVFGSTADCVRILGKPSSVTDFFSEMDDDTLKLYHYGKNRLFFQDDKLTGFEIADSSISIGEAKGQIFKVGGKLKMKGGVKYFLDFPLSDIPGSSRGYQYDAFTILYLKNQGKQWDSGIDLLFNERGELFNIGFTD